MIQKNAYTAYNNSKILTASSAELTLMLYDGAIKFANMAMVSIKQGDVEKTHNNLIKTERIIIELQSTLDHKYPVAKDFDAVYTYLIRTLRDANLNKDPERIQEALKHLHTMRDAWKEVMDRTANGATVTGNVQVS